MTYTIQGIIFDVDGVIADTIEGHYQSWKRLADEEGLNFNRQDNVALRGVTREVSLQRFLKGRPLDPDTAQAWMARKNGYFQDFLRDMTPDDALPGVRRILTEAQTMGLQLGVGSSSRNARRILERLDLIHFFSAIADGYTVVNSKPAPDIFLWVAGALNLSPRNILIFEDSQAGIQAALTGGFYVVGVGDDDTSAAHMQLPDLSTITLSNLIEQLER